MVVEAKVSPSEDPGKVALAVASVIGIAPEEVVISSGAATYSSEGLGSLEKLREQLRARRVRSAARAAMMREAKGGHTVLMLNRQAAVAGVLAVCGNPEESPLGPVSVRIRSRDVVKVIEWLADYEGG